MERIITLVAALVGAGAIGSAPVPPAQIVPGPLAVQPAVPPALPEPPAEPLTEEALIALGNAADRMTVPVTIGARGPWPFIIDTGAERTVVSRELAALLGLAAGPRLRVVAMTGPVQVASAIVPQLSVSRISHETIEAPALGAVDLGAAGMLGIDALHGHSITIDFDRQQMTIKPARRRARLAALPGEVVVSARSLYGQLIVTNAFWHGKRISVVVDTGSPLTVGNSALLAAITRRPRELGPMVMTSATGQLLTTTAFAVDRLEIGGIGFQEVRVAFSDVPPFARFGLATTPALLLGMDSLRLFRSVQIDFANREIRFALPRGLARD